MASSAKRRAAAVAADQRRQEDEEDDDLEDDMEDEDLESDDIEDYETEEDEEVHEEVTVDFEAHTMSDGDHDGIKKLLKQVEIRPVLWDSTVSGSSDQRRIDEAWRQVFLSLYLNWDRLSIHKQGVISNKVHNRWKTLRDEFRKYERERSGSTPSKKPKCAFYEELLFLMPRRQLRRSQGSIPPRQPDPPADPPVEQRPAQIKPEGAVEQQAGPSSQPTPTVAERAAGPVPSSLAGPPQRATRKRLHNKDRDLNVESEVLSMIRKLESKDGIDSFGYTVAGFCRQLPRQRQTAFMSVVFTLLHIFESTHPVVNLADLISGIYKAAHSHRAGHASSTASMAPPPQPPPPHHHYGHAQPSQYPVSGHSAPPTYPSTYSSNPNFSFRPPNGN